MKKILSSILFLSASFSAKNSQAEATCETKLILDEHRNVSYSENMEFLKLQCSDINWELVDQSIKKVSELNEMIQMGTEEFIWKKTLDFLPEPIKQCNDIKNQSQNFKQCIEKYLLIEIINQSYQNSQTVWVNAVYDQSIHDNIKVLRSPIGGCTGTLINPTHVMTAFHCISKDYSEIGVYSEHFEKFIYEPEEVSFDGEFNIKKIIPIPSFFNWTLDHTYDVAILELRKPHINGNEIKLEKWNNNLLRNQFLFSGYPSLVPIYPTQHQTNLLNANWNDFDQTIELPLTADLRGASGSLLRYWNGTEWVAVGIYRGINLDTRKSVVAPITDLILDILKK